MTNNPQIKLFESIQVRSHWSEAEEKWYFSVVDVVQVLTDSSIPKRYWSDLRRKLEKESGQPYEKIVRLKMPAADGRLRETDTADVQRLIADSTIGEFCADYMQGKPIDMKHLASLQMWLAKR